MWDTNELFCPCPYPYPTWSINEPLKRETNVTGVCNTMQNVSREEKIKCLFGKHVKIKVVMHEQRFQRVVFSRKGCDGRWERVQRRELVGIQSHRALLSALSTSISVCRGQNNMLTPKYLFSSCQICNITDLNSDTFVPPRVV